MVLRTPVNGKRTTLMEEARYVRLLRLFHECVRMFTQSAVSNNTINDCIGECIQSAVFNNRSNDCSGEH